MSTESLINNVDYNTKMDRNMKDKTIRKLWEDFINNEKYKKYFNKNI